MKFVSLLKKGLGKNSVLVIVLVLVVFTSYFRVPFLFFQQDELFGLGMFIKEGKGAIFYGLGATKIVHFVPVSMSISYVIYSIFGMPSNENL